MAEAFKVETNFDLKNELAEVVIEVYKTLKKSSFFIAYTCFYDEWLSLHPPIAKHFDMMPKWIKNAAITYFMNKYGISESCITCTDVITGTRPAIQCNVNVGEIVYRYRIKTNHGAGTSIGNFTFKCYSFYYLSLICLILLYFRVSF